MTAETNSKDKTSWWSKLKARLLRIWWLSGVFGALTLSEILPNFLGLDRIQYLLAIHLVIVSWSEIASRIGAYVGLIPFVPPLSSDLVSSFVFAVSIALPAAAVFGFRQLRRLQQAQRAKKKNDRLPLWASSALDRIDKLLHKTLLSRVIDIVMSISIFVLGWWAYYELITYEFVKTSIDYHYITIPLPSVGETITVRQPYEVTTTAIPLGIIVYMVFLSLLFLYSIYEFKKFRYGVVFVVTFFIFTEILYLTNPDWIGEKICKFALKELTDPPRQCDIYRPEIEKQKP